MWRCLLGRTGQGVDEILPDGWNRQQRYYVGCGPDPKRAGQGRIRRYARRDAWQMQGLADAEDSAASKGAEPRVAATLRAPFNLSCPAAVRLSL